MLYSHKGLMNPRKTAEKKARHTSMFSAESWSNLYMITHPETFERKSTLTLEDLLTVSIFAEDTEKEARLRQDMDQIFDVVSESTLEQLHRNSEPSDYQGRFVETSSWLRQRFNHVIDPSKAKVFTDKRSAIKYEMSCFASKYPMSIQSLTEQACDYVKSPVGYHVDLNQLWCQVCRENHAGPQCAFNVVENGKMYISCVQRRYAVFPEDEQPCVSDSKRNILFFNVNVNIQQTIVNNFASVDEVDITFEKIQFTDDPVLDDLLYDSLTTSTYSIAKLVWYLARERFNYVSRGVWYEYKNHRWKEDCMQSLIVFLSKTVAPYFRLIKERYMKHTSDAELLRSQTKKINNLIAQFTNIQLKERIVKECQAYFLENDYFKDDDTDMAFEKRLDTANHILGFTNGVYDFNLLEFRSGVPQDCITHSCRYKFVEHSDPELRQKLTNFIYDIQPHAAEREYMLLHLASCLHGDNLQEVFHIYTNQGRNGKSALADLLRATFGDYYGTVSAEMLTRERAGASAAQPEIVNLKGKRLVVASEPKASEKLNTAFIKLLTGNDEVAARRLYSGKIEEFRPQFQMILLANDIPLMDSNDNAIYMRSRILEFPTTFVANPRLPHEKLINENLKAELPSLKNEFMLYLLDYYREYLAGGRKLRPPPSVLRLVEQHRYNSDPVQQFWVTRTEEDHDDSAVITLKTMYDTYKIWYSTNFNGRAMNVNVFRKQLEKLTVVDNSVPLPEGRGACVVGIRGRKFKTDDGADDEF
ncbi:hypothetical protein GGF31_003431 [Allomyces arbusculus]|nr:hypothetical protein GGF31_003431 [Allomyces arbusculus]